MATTDSSAPIITSLEEKDCYALDVRLMDTSVEAAAQLVFSADTIYNFDIVDGPGSGSVGQVMPYTIRVIDVTRPSYATIVVADQAGNRRTIEHRYEPDLPQLPTQDMTVTAQIDVPKKFYVPIVAGQATPIQNLTAALKTGERFMVTAFPSVIPAGQTDSIEITYLQTDAVTDLDVLLLQADCWSAEIPLRGTPEDFVRFVLSDSLLDMGTVVIGNEWDRMATLKNVGTLPFNYSAGIITGDQDFAYFTIKKPGEVAPEEVIELQVNFRPTSAGEKRAVLTIYTTAGQDSIILVGRGRDLVSVHGSEQTALKLQVRPNPSSGKVRIIVTGENGLRHPTAGEIRIADLLGRQILLLRDVRVSSDGRLEREIDLGAYPAGAYTIEFTGEGFSARQTLLIER